MTYNWSYLLLALLSVNSSGETYCAVPTNEFLPKRTMFTKTNLPKQINKLKHCYQCYYKLIELTIKISFLIGQKRTANFQNLL